MTHLDPLRLNRAELTHVSIKLQERRDGLVTVARARGYLTQRRSEWDERLQMFLWVELKHHERPDDVAKIEVLPYYDGGPIITFDIQQRIEITIT